MAQRQCDSAGETAARDFDMKTIETNGITYIAPVPCGTDEWYYGISYEHGDLYEAEEVFKEGYDVEGRNLCLIHYPDGDVRIMPNGEMWHMKSSQ